MGNFDNTFNILRSEEVKLVENEPLSETPFKKTFEILEIENTPLRSTMLDATKQNPDKYADVVKLGKKTGVPTQAAFDSVDDLNAQSSFNNIDYKNLPTEFPKTNKFLLEYDNAAQFHDDVDSLTGIEYWLKSKSQYLGERYSRGRVNVELSNLQAREVYNIVGLPGAGPLTEDELKRVEHLNKLQTAITYTEEQGQFFKALGAATEQIPNYLEMGQAALNRIGEGLITGAGAGATVAGVLGQVPPLTVLPEEFATIPIGAVTGGVFGVKTMLPVARISVMKEIFELETGSAYNEFSQFKDDDGNVLDPEIAAYAASAYGVIATAMENFSLGKTLKTFSGSKALFKRALRQRIKGVLRNKSTRNKLIDLGRDYVMMVGTEGITEAAQQAAQILFGELAKTADKKAFTEQDISKALNNLFSQKSIDAMVESGIEGVRATAVIGTVGTTTSVIANRVKTETQSISEQEKIDQLNKLAKESKGVARNPDAIKEFIDQSALEDDVVYIPAAELQQYLQENDIDPAEDPAFKGVADQIDEAVNLNGDVLMPVSDFVAHVAPGEHYDALRPHMRLSADTLTQTEDTQFQAEHEQFIDGLMKQASENVEVLQESQQIYETVKESLFATGRLTEQQAALSAQIIPAQMAVLSEKTGKSIQELYDEAALTIKGPFAEKEVELAEREAALKQTAPIFFSALEQGVGNIKQEIAPTSQWSAMIKKLPIKAEELEWIGLETWLKEQKGKVSKQEILEFIQANNVKVQEVVKGGLGFEGRSIRMDELISKENEGIITEEEKNELDILEQEVSQGVEVEDDTKFVQYQLSGGENYKELLLTLSQQKIPEKRQFTYEEASDYITDRKAVEVRENGLFIKNVTTEFALNKFRENDSVTFHEYLVPDRDEFISPHFDEPNVLAHVRFNERTDADGNGILFIEEIQSDWHQKGRKKGYAKTFDQWLEGRNETEKRLYQSGSGETVKFLKERYEQYKKNADLVIDAPFKKTWPLLAIKRMVRYAAENEFDKIAWTPGEVQAERYDLSKQISKLTYQKEPDGKYTLFAYPHDGDHIEKSGLDENGVSDFVGKEISDKIVGSGKDSGVLETNDLKVGGEGMKGFYDKILPAAVNKFFKKYGGRVKTTEIDTGKISADVDIDARDEAFKRFDAGEITREERDRLIDIASHEISKKQEVWSLDITSQMKEAATEQGFTLFQDISGTFNPETNVIRLTEASNLSTFLHESAHFFLEMEKRFNPEGIVPINEWFRTNAAKIGKESNQYLDYVSNVTAGHVIRWLDDGTTGDTAIDEAIRTASHEQFARGFEQYLQEGKAPSLELREAFRAFARWLTDLYRKIRGGLRVSLDNEIRQVFDRMLATESQIAEAEAVDRYQPLFTDATMAGMTSVEFEAYQKKIQSATDKANETLRDKLIKEITRQTKKWWMEEKADKTADIVEILRGQKVYSAIDRLREKDGPIKMDRVAVREMLNVDKIPPALRNMTITGGVGMTPDDAAGFLGYNSGAEMLTDIAKARPIKVLAEEQAEAAMKAEHGDIFNDGTIDTQAEDAVHNEERGRVILQEMKALGRSQNRVTVNRKVIKQLAAENIAKLPLNKIRPTKYRRAEIKNAIAAQQALDAGDKETALQHKTQQAMNFYLWRAAVDAQLFADKIVRFDRRFNTKRVRTELAKAGNGYLEQIDGIRSRFQFRGSVKAAQQVRQDIAAWAEERASLDGDNIQLTDPVLSENFRMHYREVPFETLMGIYDSLKNINHVARFGNKIKHNEQMIEFKEIKKKVLDHLANLPDKFTPSVTDTVTQDKLATRTQWHLAQMTSTPMLMTWLDGGNRVGLMHDLTSQMMTDSAFQRQKLYDNIGSVIVDSLKKIKKADKKRHSTKVFVPQSVSPVNDGNFIGHQILAVALNTGNRSNLEKMLKGEGWVAQDAVDTDITVSNPSLQAVLSHMTESDWKLVELIWQQIDQLFPMMAEVHKKTSGLTLPKVEAVDVDTPFGKIKGGYYPVKYDPYRKGMTRDQRDKAQALADASFSPNGLFQPSATTGAKIERTGYFAPINFNFDVLMNHVDEVIQYISHYEAIKQTFKLTHDNEIREAIISKVGDSEYNQIRPWLNDIANDGRPSVSKDVWEPALRRLRFGVTLGMMGFKVSTGLMQISGFSNTAAEIGSRYAMKGLRTVMGTLTNVEEMKGMWSFVTDRSKIMANRVNTMDRELVNAMKVLKGQSGILAATQQVSMKHIALIQTYMVDLPTWYGAYYKGIEEAKSKFDVKDFNTLAEHQKALEDHGIKRADWTVENVQGTGVIKDMPRIMRSQSETGKMFTMFFTFFSKMWNMQRDTFRGAKIGQHGVTSLAAKFLFIYMIPVAYEMALRGGDDDETWYQQYLTNLALYPFQTVPIVRDIVNALGSDFTFNLSPIQAIMEKGLAGSKDVVEGAFTDEEISTYSIKGASKLISAWYGLPGVSQAWYTGEHLYDVLEQGEDLTIRELGFGPRR